MNPPAPHSAIQGYINELNTPSVTSTSHITLAGLYQAYGRDKVNQWVDDYWKALKEYHHAKR